MRVCPRGRLPRFEDPEVDTDVLVGGCAPEELKQEVAAEVDRVTAGSGLRVRIITF